MLNHSNNLNYCRSALLLLLICSLCSCAPKEKRVPDIVIEGSKISYHGIYLPLAENVNKWVKLLGEPSRKSSGANEIYVWDDKGFLCYFNLKNKKVESFAVAFRYRELDFWPKNYFEGCISIDGAIIDKNTPIMDFNYNKKGQRFREGYFPSIYHYDINDVYVRLDLDDLGYISEFSISLDSD